MNYCCRYLISAFAFLLLTSITAQAEHEHAGVLAPYPGEPELFVLSEKESRQLQKDKPIFRRQLIGKEKRFVTVFPVNASAQIVWSVIKDFSQYPDWIEDIQNVDIYKQENGILYVRFDAETKFAGKNSWFARHDYPVDDREWGTWTLDYSHLSDLDDSVGYWRVALSELNTEKSIVSYSAAVKLKPRVPAFIINLIVKSRLKQATHWVKEQAELRRELNEKGEDNI
jgi:hypothetical protein